MIVYISIGNSDDKLSQRRWADFVADVHFLLEDAGRTVHGAWHSAPAAPWQNACWCLELPESVVERIKAQLAVIAGQYEQDSIAWAEVPSTDFLGPGAA